MFGSNSGSTFNFGGASSSANATGGSNIFGNAGNSSSNNNNNNGTGAGLFGANKPTGGGLFGNSAGTNSTSGPGLFGNTANQSAPAPSSFSFGNSNNTNGTQQQSGATANGQNMGSFFGAGNNTNSRPTNTGLFGNSQSNGQNGTIFGNSIANGAANAANLANDPYGMSKLTSTTVRVENLMPSITQGPRPDNKSSITIKRKRSSTVGSNQSSPYVSHNTIIKNLSTQMKIRGFAGGSVEDVTGIFSPVRNSLIEKFVPPSTTVGSLKTDKNFKQILASSKLTEIKKLINRRKYGTQTAIQTVPNATDDDEPKRRKIVNGNGVIDEVPEPEQALLPAPTEAVAQEEPQIEVKQQYETEIPSKSSKENEEGYWCLPTVDDLLKMPYEHLSNVEDLIVGRVGFGQISFNYSVDLTPFQDSLAEELFGGVVRIKDKAVQVYPASYQKPEIGMGLNVPATITLENLAPVDPESNLPIVNPSRPEVKKHVKKLKNLKGMQFVSYDPIVGTWIFQVGHFSIWGLVDSDNEEDLDAWQKTQKEEEFLEQQRKAKEPQEDSKELSVEELTKFYPTQELRDRQGRAIGTRSLIEDTFVYKMQKNNDSQPTAVIPGGWSFAPAPDPDVSVGSLVHKRPENRDKTPEAVSDSEDIQGDSEGADYVKVSAEPESPFMDDSEIDVEIGSSIVDEKAYEPELDELDVAALEISPRFPTSKNWLEQLHLASEDSSAFNLQRNSQDKVQSNVDKILTIADIDNALFPDFKSSVRENQRIAKELRTNGKTFAEFTSDGSIVKNKSAIDDTNLSGVSVVSLCEKFKIDNVPIIQQILEKFLSSTSITKRSNGFPQVRSNSSLSFETLMGFYPEGSERQFWSLCSSLFDKSVASAADNYNNQKLVELKRKELLSTWIKKETKNEFSQLVMKNQMDTLELIFIHVVSNDLVKAAELAIETNNNHLAVLISLSGSNDSHVISSCQNQLAEWGRTNALRFIPRPILKLYLLLAEAPLNANDLRLDITEDLSWKLSLHLLLNFTDKTVLECVRELEKLGYESLYQDVHYNVLKLYTFLFEVGSYDLGSVLDRLGASPLDFSVQWFIYEILVRSSGRLDAEDSSIGDRLTLGFCEQLQQQSLYVESLFVLAHLSDISDGVARAHFHRTLMRHVFEIIPDLTDVSAKQKLIQVLHVPRALISEAISLRYRYVEDHWNEVEALIEARFWNDASVSVVRHIAPKVIIGDEAGEIAKLDDMVQRIKVQQFDGEENVGLAVYANYIGLVKSFTEDKTQRSVVSHLQYVLDNLPVLTTIDQSASTKIASTLMSKRVGDILLEVDNSFIQKDKILSLPMGESELDYFKYKLSNDDDKDVILE